MVLLGQYWRGERYAQPALFSLTKATSNILVLLLQVLFFADKKIEIEVRRTKRTKTCYAFYQEKATKGFSLLDSWFYSKSLGRIRITSEIKLIKVARPLLHENLVKKDICYHIIAGLRNWWWAINLEWSKKRPKLVPNILQKDLEPVIKVRK